MKIFLALSAVVIILTVAVGGIWYSYKKGKTSDQPTSMSKVINTNVTETTVATAIPTNSPTGTSASQSESSLYTLAGVAKHNNEANCWSVVNGKVYDLTSWINRHEGGADKILSMCGRDASADFNGEHSRDREPQAELKAFYLADLSN